VGQLDQVARLEIVGMWHERDLEPQIIHVFGRTRDIPHTYFYRRREGQRWTAWERLDLDIEGDHLIPVVYEGRLRLFWPVFQEEAETASDKKWVIQLAGSTYYQKNWSPKIVS